ncbi:MAG: hypothetical protein R2724_10440 [Bryobacterales bacterium]
MAKKQQYRLYDAFAPFYDLYWGDWYLDDCRQELAEPCCRASPQAGACWICVAARANWRVG